MNRGGGLCAGSRRFVVGKEKKKKETKKKKPEMIMKTSLDFSRVAKKVGFFSFFSPLPLSKKKKKPSSALLSSATAVAGLTLSLSSLAGLLEMHISKRPRRGIKQRAKQNKKGKKRHGRAEAVFFQLSFFLPSNSFSHSL